MSVTCHPQRRSMAAIFPALMLVIGIGAVTARGAEPSPGSSMTLSWETVDVALPGVEDVPGCSRWSRRSRQQPTLRWHQGRLTRRIRRRGSFHDPTIGDMTRAVAWASPDGRAWEPLLLDAPPSSYATALVNLEDRPLLIGSTTRSPHSVRVAMCRRPSCGRASPEPTGRRSVPRRRTPSGGVRALPRRGSRSWADPCPGAANRLPASSPRCSGQRSGRRLMGLAGCARCSRRDPNVSPRPRSRCGSPPLPMAPISSGAPTRRPALSCSGAPSTVWSGPLSIPPSPGLGRTSAASSVPRAGSRSLLLSSEGSGATDLVVPRRPLLGAGVRGGRSAPTRYGRGWPWPSDPTGPRQRRWHRLARVGPPTSSPGPRSWVQAWLPDGSIVVGGRTADAPLRIWVGRQAAG